MTEKGRGSLPPLPVRIAGRAMTEAVARVPGAWRVLRGPTRRFFEDAAAGWDERVRPDDEEHLAPLVAAVERLELSPRRILDVGTGTGAAALWLARRFEQAEVLGVDVAPEMIDRARAKAAGRVRFEVGDTNAAVADGPFDLVVHLNCPVLFKDVAAALTEGGSALVVASLGPRTPFFTSHAALRRGFRRAGLDVVDAGRGGAGTWLAAQRPKRVRGANQKASSRATRSGRALWRRRGRPGIGCRETSERYSSVNAIGSFSTSSSHCTRPGTPSSHVAPRRSARRAWSSSLRVWQKGWTTPGSGRRSILATWRGRCGP